MTENDLFMNIFNKICHSKQKSSPQWVTGHFRVSRTRKYLKIKVGPHYTRFTSTFTHDVKNKSCPVVIWLKTRKNHKKRKKYHKKSLKKAKNRCYKPFFRFFPSNMRSNRKKSKKCLIIYL